MYIYMGRGVGCAMDFIYLQTMSELKGIEILLFLFSSPEHEVLMVSYCDQSMSVILRPSCVVNNLF